MKKLTIKDAPTIVLGLQDEIRRTEDSRYDHRLHGVLLVAQGLSCLQVSRLLGDGPRTVQYWVNSFEKRGLAGLTEGQRSGRPSRLDEEHMQTLGEALRKAPHDMGLSGNMWDGKTLSEFIKKEFNVTLGVRRCQYLFRDLGFRLRKPRPIIARADPQLQQSYKKSHRVGKRR